MGSQPGEPEFYDASKRPPVDVIREALDYLHSYAMSLTNSPPIEGDGQFEDGVAALDALVASLTAARQENERLRAILEEGQYTRQLAAARQREQQLTQALAEFGEHSTLCALEATGGDTIGECSCGLAAVLAGEAPPTAPPPRLLDEWFDTHFQPSDTDEALESVRQEQPDAADAGVSPHSGHGFTYRKGGFVLTDRNPGRHEPYIVTMELRICNLCLEGRGGECHSPGCMFWMCPAINPDQARVLRDWAGLAALASGREREHEETWECHADHGDSEPRLVLHGEECPACGAEELAPSTAPGVPGSPTAPRPEAPEEQTGAPNGGEDS